jgi:hypothetical protein
MAGSIKIRITGCDGKNTTLVLSSTAEPDGGDHYAQIFWPQDVNVVVYNELTNSWSPAGSGFLFTSAGESYLLRASGPEALKFRGDLTFPYRVTALYAPDWAAVEDFITPSLDEDECCPPGHPNGSPSSLKYLTLDGACTGDCVSGTIDISATKGVTFMNNATFGTGIVPPECVAIPVDDVGTGGTKTYQFSLDAGSWNFYENPLNMSGSASVPSGIGTCTVSVQITKPANSLAVTCIVTVGTITITKLGSYTLPDELCAASLPSCTFTELDESGTFDIVFEPLECTTLRLKAKCHYTGTSHKYLRPATYDFCCQCEDVGTGYTYAGWNSGLSIVAVELVKE